MQVGSWCTMPGSWSAEALGRAGFSWVVVDLQHGVGEGLLGAVQAVELGGATPYVRVRWNEPQAIMRALDHGVRPG